MNDIPEGENYDRIDVDDEFEVPEDFAENLAKDFGEAVKDGTIRTRAQVEADASKTISRELKRTMQDFSVPAIVRGFIEDNPIMYDMSRLWWAWDKEKCVYKIIDETQIIHALKYSTDATELHKSKVISEFINEFKTEGRDISIKIKTPPLNWVQFGDMIYDIDTHKTFKSTPDYFFVNALPYSPSNDSSCPMLDKLFTEWVGIEHVDLLYQIIAYCCYRDYPLHYFFCFIGAGSNGKSTFLQILDKFIGADNISSSSLDVLTSSRFESASLYKKLVCLMGETNFGVLSRTEILKKLVGGDKITYEFKNKQPFTDANYAKILIATNTLSETTDKTEGFYRRWIIIDFPNRFDGKMDILSNIPEYEYHNLSRKVMEILPKLLSEREFKGAGSVEDRMKRYEEKSNPLEKFMALHVKRDFDCWITKHSFLEYYNAYLAGTGGRKVTDKELGIKMNNMGFETRYVNYNREENGVIVTRRARAWVGIAWVDSRRTQDYNPEPMVPAMPDTPEERLGE